MKTLLKLIIAALIVHATFRAGSAYWRYYQFKDEVQQVALFSERRSESEIHQRVVDLAKAQGIPMTGEDVTVRRVENHTMIVARYVEQVELVPRYFYPWAFDVDVDAFTIVPKEVK